VTVVGRHRLEGVEEGLLDGVLGARPGEEARAVAQQRAPVAVNDRLEGAVVARADQIDQALVGLRAQDRLAGKTGGLDQLSRRQRRLPPPWVIRPT
jgi:hypothetical protein